MRSGACLQDDLTSFVERNPHAERTGFSSVPFWGRIDGGALHEFRGLTALGFRELGLRV